LQKLFFALFFGIKHADAHLLCAVVDAQTKSGLAANPDCQLVIAGQKNTRPIHSRPGDM